MGLAVAFAQKKTGSGKTTLLMHLAHSWAHADRTVGLVDLDPRKSLTGWAGLGRELHLNLMQAHDWRAAGDIRDSAKKHDLTLVDCPTGVEAVLFSAISACDLTVIPCQPTGIDIWATKGVLDICKRKGTPACVVMNRIPADGNATDDAVTQLAAYGAHVLDSRLGNRVAFSAGVLSGKPIAGSEKSSTAKDEIESLRRELDGILAKT